MLEDYEENYITGWVKLYRSFIKWEWFEVPNMVTLFIYCLLKANHKDKKWRGIEIKKGTFVTSYSSISKETNLSVKKIRLALSKLEQSGEIMRKSGNQNTVITICKYDTYQQNKEDEGKQRANGGQTKGNQRATTKKYKNIKKIYCEEDFLNDWVKCRQHYLKKPTHIKKLDTFEKINLDNALKDYSPEEIKISLKGLFNQKNKNISAMYLRPKHFLENVNKYYNAEMGKDYELYGKEKVNTEL